MRIGLFLNGTTIDGYVADCKQAQAEGYGSIWSPQIFGIDAMQAISVASREVPGLRFGTSVVPTYPRHPMVMAQMALTTSQASGGRFDLGIGLSHQVVIEGMYGMSFDKPANHMREYLSILLPLLRDQRVNHSGELLTGRGQLQIPEAPAVPVLIAAMAPVMLKLAGAVADGTILWMTGAKTTRDHIRPTMEAAAEAAGRPKPRTIAGLPMCLTSDVAAMRATAAKEYVIYGQLPSYRAMLDREGLAGPEDLAVIGDESVLGDAIEAMRAAGCDELAINPFGTPDQQAATRAFCGSLARG
jgi:F420-dependent oxidoreductase-like protein